MKDLVKGTRLGVEIHSLEHILVVEVEVIITSMMVGVVDTSVDSRAMRPQPEVGIGAVQSHRKLGI